ncbi:MAG: aminotransferase class V-fold PLP-dependent enzyme [Dehalococcoidia bacterium]|nr:aminotransferase class V-fold PLP-dependent enzyme [Dehalococcoidia bacterium]
MAAVAAGPQRTELVVRSARGPADFDAIRRLNEAVFAREIGQHEPSADGRLVDQFEARSRFYTAWRGNELVGMVCYATGAGGPLSIEAKLDDARIIDAYRPTAIEIRLLAVRPGERNSRAAWLMLRDLARDVVQLGYRYALISGIDSQMRLYQRFGFTALGPPVRRRDALFTPMVLTLDGFLDFGRRHVHLDLLPEATAGSEEPAPILLTPGPVAVHADVRAALLASVDMHHRSTAFRALLRDVHGRLRRLFRVPDDIEIVLVGAGGTGATEMLLVSAGQIGDLLVVSNGHFGERLASMAADLGIRARVMRYSPHDPLPLAEVEAALGDAAVRSVAVVDMETSVGASNREGVRALRGLTRRLGRQLVVDAVSSLGGEPGYVDDLDADAAATVSGKALGGVPGVAILFLRRSFLEARTGQARSHALSVDRHLDAWRERSDLPFTPPIQAFVGLDAALRVLEREGLETKWRHQAESIAIIEEALRALGCLPVEVYAPSATTRTWQPPGGRHDSSWALAELEHRGLIGYQNQRYHRPLDVFQTSVMGYVEAAELARRLGGMAPER